MPIAPIVPVGGHVEVLEPLPTIRVLVVEDDSDDYFISKKLLSRIEGISFQLEWANTFESALESIAARPPDVGLFDYQLGRHSGVDLLREIRALGCNVPVIMLTGHTDRSVDVEAMQAGASDFIGKDSLTADSLDRALRYSLEHARLLDAAERARTFLRASVDALASLICVLDDHGVIVVVNAAWKTFLAGALPQMADFGVGLDYMEVWAGINGTTRDRRAAISDGLQTLLEGTRDSLTLQYAYPVGGSERTFELNAARFESTGQTHIVISHEDITARIESAAGLSYLAAIVASSADAIISVSLDGEVRSWNAAAARMYGVSAEEIKGTPIGRLTGSDDGRELELALSRAAQGESSYGVEATQRSRDGRLLDVEITVSPLRDALGNLTAVSIIARDITEQKRALEALRASEQRLQGILDNSPAVIFLKDLDGRYEMANKRFEEITGRSKESILGRTVFDLFPAEVAEKFTANDRSVIDLGSAVQFEEVVPHKDGPRSLISMKFPLLDETGRPRAVCGISTDVTERIGLEEQLRQAQRMESVGRLAGGIAHDFNNLLTVIGGYGELVARELPPSGVLRRNMEEITKAGKRAADLTRQLLAFSRRQMLTPTIFDINESVLGMTSMLRRLIGEDVELTLDLEPVLGRVRADKGQVEQVLVNLAVNARDAMPFGGVLTVRTANIVVDEHSTLRHSDLDMGAYTAVVVEDTGTGIDESLLSKIFEPFFTTKEQGKGTGLGLSTVYGIVRQSGGAVTVASELGKGTTFSVYFPHVEEEESPTHAEPETAAPGGAETVLLVEDEAGVRNLAAIALRSRGYMVIEAANGCDALASCEQNPKAFNLLVTDVIMPRMGGRELAERMREARPGLKVLFMSGYAENGVVENGVIREGVALLQKPFTTDALARKVREVLDEP